MALAFEFRPQPVRAVAPAANFYADFLADFNTIAMAAQALFSTTFMEEDLNFTIVLLSTRSFAPLTILSIRCFVTSLAAAPVRFLDDV